MVFVFHRDRDVAEVIPVSRPLDRTEIALHAIGVVVCIDIDRRVMPKVERIGARGKSPVELVRIQNLHAESLPATGRAAVKETRPTFTETAELLFDVGDELIGNRVTVRSEVLGIHCIAVVVIRIGMLNLDNKHSRKIRAGPFLIEVISLVLHDAVVTIEVCSLIAYALEIFLGRLASEAREVRRKVAVIDGQRIAGLRVIVKSGRQEHVCAKVHIPAPELAKKIAFYPDVFDEFGVRRRRNRGDDLIHNNGDWFCRCGDLY